MAIKFRQKNLTYNRDTENGYRLPDKFSTREKKKNDDEVMTRLSHTIGIETKLLNPPFSLGETASITFFITSPLFRELYKDAPFEKKCEFKEIKLISSIQRERTPQ